MCVAVYTLYLVVCSSMILCGWHVNISRFSVVFLAAKLWFESAYQVAMEYIRSYLAE